MIDIEDVKRLTLGPDDVLVFQVKGVMSDETRDKIEAMFAEKLPNLDRRVLVIDTSVSLAVLSKADVAAVKSATEA